MTKQDQHEQFVKECRERKIRNKKAMIETMKGKIRHLESKIKGLEEDIARSLKI